jgi:predicted dehydrogenase
MFRFRLACLLALVSAFTAFTLPAQTAQAHLRVAVVGLEHGHVDGFLASLAAHPEVELVGIVDADASLRADVAARFHLPQSLFFPDIAAMIEARHPQALLVYTSVAGHRAAIESAAHYRLPVMVEKPLSTTVEDALAIRRAARQAGIPVLVNYETTWYASNAAAAAEVGPTGIGPIRRIVVHDGHQGPQEIGVSPTFLSWLTDPAQNGAGALFDFGCYGADLATVLMHGQPPLSVTAVTHTDKPALYPKVDDEATVILQYPQAQAVLQASWNWPFNRKDMEIYGAAGYALTVGADQLRLRHPHDAQERLLAAPPLAADQRDSLSYLGAVLAGRIHPEGDLTALDTNLIVVQILDAARRSAHTGQTVLLTPLEK